MADDIDRANDLAELELADRLAEARKAEILPGEPGECDLCGEWSGRLVDGACSPCRDRYKLP